MNKDDMEMDFGQLFEASEKERGDRFIAPGETVKGKVVLITSDTVFIDYGAKSEGWAEREEFQDDQGDLSIKPGSEVELTFIEYGPSGAHLGSGLRRTAGGAGNALLQKAFDSGIWVEGTVTEVNKGGLSVNISGATVFCPFSQIDVVYCDHPEVFVGTTQKFKVTQYEEEGRNIVVSRRAVLQAEREAAAAKVRERLALGEIFEGRITRLTPFGAFIDLGGVEGLLHISEISRAQVKTPSDVLSQDQEVTVQVIKLETDEKGNERISLSMKTLEPDPWETGLPFKEGDIISGAVRNLTAYGAFVELVPGLEGLVHISEISYKRIHHPKDVLEEGQHIEVKILEINQEQRRVSLSIRETGPYPGANETVIIGQESQGDGGDSGQQPFKPLMPKLGLLVRGIVRSVKPYGCFLDLPELGAHQRGLLHNSQLEGADSGRGKTLKEGDEVQVEIIKIDEQGRISLSRKSLLENQDRASISEYQDRVKDTGGLGTMADLFKKFKK
jgi:small subunit ribosomal protein S1